MMDIRRAAALLLALVMIAALTVGCGKKQSDTPTDTPAAGADGRTPAQQPAKLVCYNGSVTLRFVREAVHQRRAIPTCARVNDRKTPTT